MPLLEALRPLWYFVLEIRTGWMVLNLIDDASYTLKAFWDLLCVTVCLLAFGEQMFWRII